MQIDGVEFDLKEISDAVAWRRGKRKLVNALDPHSGRVDSVTRLVGLLRYGAHAVDGMNLHFLIQRLIGRATCRLEKGAFLSHTARIRNALGDSDKIVIGGHSHIRGELMIFGHGGRISIGEWCYVGVGTRIWSAASIEIGNRVLISHSVNIFDNSDPSAPGGTTARAG